MMLAVIVCIRSIFRMGLIVYFAPRAWDPKEAVKLFNPLLNALKL